MKRTDFSVDWLFAACAPDTELLPWNAQFTPVDLPHDWQIRHADDLYRDGTLFYRKYFFVTDVPGTRRMLWFGGAYMDTTVFVNGTEVGQWKYGYTSFWFDITDALHEGQNEVLVRCNLRHPNSRWYSGAGLYRNVELWEAPDLHLMPDGLYVAAKEGDNGAWTVAVTAEAGSVTAASAGRTLTLHLTDDNGSLLGTAAIPADAWAALPSPLPTNPPSLSKAVTRQRDAAPTSIDLLPASLKLPSLGRRVCGNPPLSRLRRQLPPLGEPRYSLSSPRLAPWGGSIVLHPIPLIHLSYFP